jgi:hypothetical protein
LNLKVDFDIIIKTFNHFVMLNIIKHLGRTQFFSKRWSAVIACYIAYAVFIFSLTGAVAISINIMSHFLLGWDFSISLEKSIIIIMVFIISLLNWLFFLLVLEESKSNNMLLHEFKKILRLILSVDIKRITNLNLNSTYYSFYAPKNKRFDVLFLLVPKTFIGNIICFDGKNKNKPFTLHSINGLYDVYNFKKEIKRSYSSIKRIDNKK